MMKLAKDPGDFSQPRALLGVIDFRVAARCGCFYIAPQEMAEEINSPLQVWPQAGIQEIIHETVLIAAAGALNVFPLQQELKSPEFLRKTGDLFCEVFHCLFLTYQYWDPRHRKKWQ